MPTPPCLPRAAVVLLATLSAMTLAAPTPAEEPRTLAQGTPPASPAVRAAGIVRAPGGKPAAGCPVYLILNAYGKRLEATSIRLCGQTVTDTAGKFAVTSTAAHPETGQITVLAWRKGVAVGLAPLPPAGSDPLAVELRPVRKVRGTLKDSAGKPVAGATITPEHLTLQSIGVGSHSWASTILPDSLRELWAVRSDAQGDYLIPHVPEQGSLSLQVRLPGYNDITTYITAQEAAPRPLVLHRRTRIRGTLRLSNSAMPIEEISLIARREQQSVSGKVLGDGSFEIDHVPPGTLNLTVSTPSTSEWQPSAHMTVTVTEGRALENLVLPVEAVRGVRVTGRIADEETGKGVPAFWVNLPTGEGLKTDAEGRYSFYARPGKVGITLYRYSTLQGDYLLPGEQVQRTGTGNPGETITLDEIRLRKGRAITVRVVDAAGKPVKEAMIRNVDSSDPWEETPLATDARGEATLRGLAPEGAVRITARTRTGYSLPTPVDLKTLSGPVTLVVRPEHAAYLTGRAVDDTGKPIRGASVQVTAMYGRWGDYPAILKTDAEGRFRSDALPPQADYTLKVEAPRHRTAMSEIWKASTGGQHDFGVIRLVRQLGYVQGVVVDSRGRPVSGARVFNSGDADRPLETMSEAGGRFRLEGLESGACYVFAEKAGHPLGLLFTRTPAQNARLVLRTQTPPAHSSELGRARERLALKLIDRSLAEAGKKPEAWNERQRAIDLLVPRDILRATEIAMAAGQPERNSLSHDLGRVALKRSVDEAIACIRQVDHPYWRTRNLLSLAAEGTPAQAGPILSAAVLSARGVPELMQQLHLLAECADRMRHREIPGAEALLRECAARAARLGVKEGEAYVRGVVATRLAEIDLDAALALIAPIAEESERQRHVANIALRYVTRSPEKALQLLNTAGEEWQSRQAVSRMCARLAVQDPDGAERLLGRLQDHRQRIRTLLWMAERIKDRKRALATLNRAEQELTAWTAATTHQDTYDPPALYLAHAAHVAKKLGSPSVGRLVARVLATRPPLSVQFGDPLEQYRNHVRLTVLIALLDPAAGRNLLEIIRPRLETIKASRQPWTEQEIRQHLLLATAAANPTQGEAYLNTLKQSGGKPSAIATAEFLLDPRIQRERLGDLLGVRSPEEEN